MLTLIEAICADAHVTPVVACTWLDGPPVAALTADSRGRVVHYNVSAYLSIMGAVLLHNFSLHHHINALQSWNKTRHRVAQ